MFERKEALLNKYYQLTVQFLQEGWADNFPNILDERQACIEEVTDLDQIAGCILLNPALKELLERIRPLEEKLQEKVKDEQQKVLSAISSLKKEKNMKQQYGESAFVPSGIFYDKRK